MFFFFKQKTAYEMRISDWSSDVCSSDLRVREQGVLDLSRVDVEGARHDHVVLAVHDEQVALVVEVADVARVEPAILVDGPLGLHGTPPVARQDRKSTRLNSSH